MNEISRRQILSMAALTPVAAALLPTAMAGKRSAIGSQPMTPARERIQRLHLPNVPLLTQDGKQVHFYDDLVKDKVVTLNFFYAKCDELCPLVIGNLVKVQKLLRDVSRDIHMYSITLKPEEDSPSVIKSYMQMHGVQPGWTFLTGKPDDVERLRKGLGFSYPDPAIDKDKTQHIGNIRYGNEPLMLWSACPGMAHAKWVAETISWMVRPDTNRVQQTP